LAFAIAGATSASGALPEAPGVSCASSSMIIGDHDRPCLSLARPQRVRHCKAGTHCLASSFCAPVWRAISRTGPKPLRRCDGAPGSENSSEHGAKYSGPTHFPDQLTTR
jgi:hypothetical protein